MLKMLANQNGYRQQALCVSDGSLEGFSREYHRGDSLESFSGVCLWQELLRNIRGVTLWRVSLECVSGGIFSGISQE
jgi:hypothetical protein